jgi:hypothetical protein
MEIGDMDVEIWTWRYGRGDMDYGDMNMKTWTMETWT